MGKGSGCFPSKGSKFIGGGGGTPHETLETGPSSDAKAPETNQAPAPAAAAAAPAATPAAPAVEKSIPAPAVEKSTDDDTPVKSSDAAAAPVSSATVKVFIV